MKKRFILGFISATALSSALFIQSPQSLTAKADAVSGDVIVTLGEDLTLAQKQTVYGKMGIKESDASELVFVSNEEEHKYLGNYIPEKQIGTKALSSALIIVGEKDSGINVETNNISYVSEQMYHNALVTAGVKDVDVFVTAPFKVSGTGALTGIIKSYEQSTGKKIDETQKQVANEEMVATAELGDEVGVEKASEFFSTVKEEVVTNKLKDAEEIKNVIINVAGDMNINLSDASINEYTAFFEKLNKLDLDTDALKQKFNDATESIKEKMTALKDSEEAKGIGQAIADFFSRIVEWFKSLFN